MKQTTTTKTMKKITIQDKARELGGILRLAGTIDILTALTIEPKTYTELEKDIRIPHTTFIRRLDKLQNLRLITKVPITSQRRETHQYTLTSEGNKLLNYLSSFIRYPTPTKVQKVIDIFEKRK